MINEKSGLDPIDCKSGAVLLLWLNQSKSWWTFNMTKQRYECCKYLLSTYIYMYKCILWKPESNYQTRLTSILLSPFNRIKPLILNNLMPEGPWSKEDSWLLSITNLLKEKRKLKLDQQLPVFFPNRFKSDVFTKWVECWMILSELTNVTDKSSHLQYLLFKYVQQVVELIHYICTKNFKVNLVMGNDIREKWQKWRAQFVEALDLFDFHQQTRQDSNFMSSS